MAGGPWEAYHERWARQVPPLRPHASDVAAMTTAAGGGRALLLGATPELAGIGASLVAIDWSAAAIRVIWPGDDARRRIVLADWRALPLADAAFDAAIGDGAANVIPAADLAPMLREVARVLAPGGRLALRCFAAPDAPESLSDVRAAMLAGATTFHAAKWRLAMALAAGGEARMATVHAVFEALFPDRAALAAATGWPLATIAEIDAYAGSSATLAFPTRAGLRAALPKAYDAARFVEARGYPLAERCPLLVAIRR